MSYARQAMKKHAPYLPFPPSKVAFLKSTGERVNAYAAPDNPATGKQRWLCYLPPQAPGHAMRVQLIGHRKLDFKKEK